MPLALNVLITISSIEYFSVLEEKQNDITVPESSSSPISQKKTNTWRLKYLAYIVPITFLEIIVYFWIARQVGNISKAAKKISRGKGNFSSINTPVRELQALEESLTEIAYLLQVKSATSYVKNSLLADMSHELRSPLNAILGFAQIMQKESSLTRSQQENMAIINRSGKRLLSIINDVVDLSKIETNRLTLENDRCDFFSWLDNLESNFKIQADKQNLAFKLVKEPNLPQYLCLDENRLRQIVGNLVDYALRYTPIGSVTVRVSKEDLTFKHKLSMYFEIESDNFSLNQEELTTLFDPRARVRQKWKSPESSSLSLPIARQLIQLMGGDIAIASKNDVPQSIVFRFNIQTGIDTSQKLEIKSTTKKIVGLKAEQAEYKILIVDDSKTNRKIMAQLLEPIGFKVREAVNGKEAVDIWLDWQPHMIWMDIRMPVMDGYEATEQIKSSAKTSSPPIVALTASTLEEERSLFQASGCDDFVGKPFSEDIIFDKIAQHLGVRYEYESAFSAISNSYKLMPDALNIMGDRWLLEAEEAAITLDKTLLTELLRQIPEEHSNLQEALQKLVDKFDFEEILNLVKQSQLK